MVFAIGRWRQMGTVGAAVSIGGARMVRVGHGYG